MTLFRLENLACYAACTRNRIEELPSETVPAENHGSRDAFLHNDLAAHQWRMCPPTPLFKLLGLISNWLLTQAIMTLHNEPAVLGATEATRL